MAAIRNLVTGKQLMIVLLKLFDFCVKVKANRQELIKVEMNAITIMLGALNLVCLCIRLFSAVIWCHRSVDVESFWSQFCSLCVSCGII